MTAKRKKPHPTSLVMPDDLKTSIKRACRKQGCSMGFKIVEILRTWEAAFFERERELGRGQTE